MTNAQCAEDYEHVTLKRSAGRRLLYCEAIHLLVCRESACKLTKRGHDERCRDRMEKEMERDEEGQRLLQGARSRGEAFIEEKIRKADEGQKAEENAKRERENGKEGDIHVPTKKTRNEEEQVGVMEVERTEGEKRELTEVGGESKKAKVESEKEGGDSKRTKI